MNIDTSKIKQKPKWWQNKIFIAISVCLLTLLLIGLVILIVYEENKCPKTNIIRDKICETCPDYSNAATNQTVCLYPNCNER